MRRRLFNFASAFSMVLFLASLVGYIRSQFVFESWSHPGVPRVASGVMTTRSYSVSSGHGIVHLYRAKVVQPGALAGAIDRPAASWSHHVRSPNLSAASGFRALRGRFSWSREVQSAGAVDVEDLNISLPWWFVTLAAAVLPAGWAVGRWRRRRTTAAGRCRKCGYDLRATPERCPECGAAPTAPAEP
jgi:hypothetical protein